MQFKNFFRMPFALGTPAETVRFCVVGATTTVVYVTIILSLLKLTGLPLAPASAVAYLFAMVLNYLLQRNWTFVSKKKHSIAVPRFIFVHAIGIVINALTLQVLTVHVGLRYAVSQIVAVLLIAVWSYLALKIWVFVKGPRSGRQKRP